MRAVNFVQQAASSIAGTNGDGAVTMEAITGSPTFAQAGARSLRYVMEQKSTGTMESGLGSITAGVLTRAKPQVTWDGTTFKDGSGGVAVTPLQFGSAPAAGDVVIRSAPTAEDRAPVLHARSSVVIGGEPWREYPISAHLHQANGGAAVSLVAGIQYYAVYRVETAGLLTGVQFEVMGAAVNPSNVRLGLYEIGVNGMPGSLLATFNPANTSTTGIKTDTAVNTWAPAGGVYLTPGWVVIGVLADAAVQLRCGAGNLITQAPSPYGKTGAYGQGYVLSVSQPYSSGLQAAFPNAGQTWPGNGSANNLNNIWIGLKVAA